MITIESKSYIQSVNRTSFTCKFEKSGLRIIFIGELPGDLTEAQIIEGMQGEYDKWLERNNIP